MYPQARQYVLVSSQDPQTDPGNPFEKSSATSIPDTASIESTRYRLSCPNPHRTTLFVASVLFILSFLLSAGSVIFVFLPNSRINNNSKLQDTSAYCSYPPHVPCFRNIEPTLNSLLPAPLFNALPISLYPTKINGSFLNTQPPSIYREPPSPSVDAAWDRISFTRTIPITSADVLALGKNPSLTAKFPLSHKLGPDAHVAQVDVFHQIHCLNLLRKELNFDYYYGQYYPGGRPSEPDQQPLHVSHCIYLLLQNIMCEASVDAITHRWVDVQKHPIPDFSVNKVCRDFEAVLDYVEAKSVDFMGIRRPVDAPVVVASQEFRELFFQTEYAANDVEHPGTEDT